MRMINWYVGLKTDFKKNTGPLENKYYKDYLDNDEWKAFESTYADYHYQNIWNSLFEMCILFRKAAVKIAGQYSFEYPYDYDNHVMAFLKHVKQLPKDAKSIY